MSYIVGQYNNDSNTVTMNSLSGGEMARFKPSEVDDLDFAEEYLHYNNFKRDKVYYFHCLIKKLYTKQSFDIQLVAQNNIQETQTIHTVNVDAGTSGWYDVEFVFKPVKDFDRMAFMLQRTRKDYTSSETRYPVIICLELSEVLDLLPGITGGAPLLKAGVQADPGMLMVINGEGIRLGKSGLYEVRNGLIEIDFFSVVSGKSTISNLENTITNIDENYNSANLELEDLSCSLLDETDFRTLPDFSLDYVYEKGGES